MYMFVLMLLYVKWAAGADFCFSQWLNDSGNPLAQIREGRRQVMLLSHLGVGNMGVELQHSQTHQTDITAAFTSLGSGDGGGTSDPLGLCFSIRKAELTKRYVFLGLREAKPK